MIRDLVGQEINIGDYVVHPYSTDRSHASLQIGRVTNIIDHILVVTIARYMKIPRGRYKTEEKDWRILMNRKVRLQVYYDYSDRVVKIDPPERIKELFSEFLADQAKVKFIYNKYSEVSQE